MADCFHQLSAAAEIFAGEIGVRVTVTKIPLHSSSASQQCAPQTILPDGIVFCIVRIRHHSFPVRTYFIEIHEPALSGFFRFELPTLNSLWLTRAGLPICMLGPSRFSKPRNGVDIFILLTIVGMGMHYHNVWKWIDFFQVIGHVIAFCLMYRSDRLVSSSAGPFSSPIFQVTAKW
jgi:hypothetical protein